MNREVTAGNEQMKFRRFGRADRRKDALNSPLRVSRSRCSRKIDRALRWPTTCGNGLGPPWYFVAIHRTSRLLRIEMESPVAWTPNRRSVLLTATLALTGCAPDSRPDTPAEPSNRIGSPNGLQAETPAGESAGRAASPEVAEAPQASREPADLPSREEITRAFNGIAAKYWGLEAPGVMTAIPAASAGIALTVDFCGGPDGNASDMALLTLLRQQHLPATLFLNARWIAANRALAKDLAADPLFELANHGTAHRPLSVSGKTAYGISGTKSPAEVYDEIVTNNAVLTELTGRRPRFFRAGTAYMDEVATQITKTLGYTPVGFSINGDAGATLSPQMVANEVSRAKASDIVIVHGNHPAGGTAQGLTRALAVMKTRGITFVPMP